MQQYDGYGIRFEYPEGWSLSEDLDEGTISINVDAPDAGFWMVSIMKDRPSADEIIESALASFHEEYEHVDVYDSDDAICLLPTASKDLDIMCLDLVGKVRLRACEADDCSIFVMWQLMEADLDDVGAGMKAMTSGLTWESSREAGDPYFFDNLFKQDEPL